jgi:hypothetical protein
LKNIIPFIVILLFVNSCSLDDEANFHYELVPTISATFPQNFVLGETYKIPVAFDRPTDCHFFYDYSFDKISQNTRRIGVVTAVFTDQECNELVDSSMETSFDFIVLYEGTYTFEFWTGHDLDGNDEYLIYEVPVDTQNN